MIDLFYYLICNCNCLYKVFITTDYNHQMHHRVVCLVAFLSATAYGLSPDPLFSRDLIFFQDRSNDAKHPDSDRVIGWMSQSGNNWLGDQLRADLSFHVFEANCTTEYREFVRSGNFYNGECDFLKMPVPPFGAVEGEDGYQCTGGGDCHLLVVDRERNLLFEQWKTDIVGGGAEDSPFNGGCATGWDLTKDYGWNTVRGYDYARPGRGIDCTSADAGGLPITPLLFTPEELDAGIIRHALRYVLPNRNIRRRKFVFPITHGTSTSGPADAPPYGAQLRLKPTADLMAAHQSRDFDALSKGAKVIITALQTYGMFLTDGGRIPLLGVSDRYSSIKYCDHDRFMYCDEDPDRLFHSHDLKFLGAQDFEMLDNGGVERDVGGQGCTLLDPWVEPAAPTCVTDSPNSMTTAVPTATPTAVPTAIPTAVPTSPPTLVPTGAPVTTELTLNPAGLPATAIPTVIPTGLPVVTEQTSMPTSVPTERSVETASPVVVPIPETSIPSRVTAEPVTTPSPGRDTSGTASPEVGGNNELEWWVYLLIVLGCLVIVALVATLFVILRKGTSTKMQQVSKEMTQHSTEAKV